MVLGKCDLRQEKCSVTVLPSLMIRYDVLLVVICGHEQLLQRETAVDLLPWPYGSQG